MATVTALLLLVALLALLFGAAWWAGARLVRAERVAALHWAVFGALLAVSMAVVALAAESRMTVLLPVGNGLFLLALAAVHRGLACFLGLPTRDGIVTGVLVLAMVVIVAVPSGSEGLALRVATLSAAAVGLTLISMAGSRRRLLGEFGRGTTHMTLATMGLWIGALFGVRGVLAIATPEALGADVTEPTALNLVTALLLPLLLTQFNLVLAYLLIARLVGRLQSLSERDPLTKLLNRRALDTALQREWQRFRRHGHGFAVVMVDVDRFKRLNDEHGHAAGDTALRELAQRLATSARQGDVLARTGGEEFCLLMPDTDEAGAVAAAHRIRMAVRAAAVLHPGAALPMSMTVSVGVAVVQPGHTDPYDPMVAADAAMYRAKEAGGDRVDADPPAHMAPVPMAPAA